MKARILLCSLILGALLSHEASAQSDTIWGADLPRA
jgi:hypothetical protein